MNIEKLKQNFEKELGEYGLNSKKSSHAAIILEELLLLYAPDSEQATVKITKNRKSLYARISIPGESRTPRELEETCETYLLDTAVNNTGFVLEYSREEQNNIITLTLETYFSVLNNLQFAFRFLEKSKSAVLTGCLFNLVAITANLFIPYFTGTLVSSYATNQFDMILWSVSMLLVGRIIYFIFIALAGINYNKVSFNMFGLLQTKLLEKLFSVKDEKLESYGSAQYIQRINADAAEISGDVANAFNIVSNAIYYIGVLIASFTFDKVVFFAELVTFAGLLLLENGRLARLDANRRRLLAREEEHAELIQELVEGACEIKLLGMKRYLLEKTADSAKRTAEIKNYSLRDNTKYRTINSLYIHVCFFGIMLYLGIALHNSTITSPTALVLFNYFTIISMPLVELIQRYMDFKKNFSISCERANALLCGNEFPKEPSGAVRPDTLKGDIAFDHVSFAYNVPGQSGQIVLYQIAVTCQYPAARPKVGCLRCESCRKNPSGHLPPVLSFSFLH